MATRGRPSEDLLRCARATGAAWSELRKAEAALARHAARRAPELRPAVDALREANHALQRAYGALAPGRKTFRRKRGAPDLWRCRYCGVLVFSQDRRTHLQYIERVPTDGLKDAQFDAHYTMAEDAPSTNDEEDELDGW